MVNNGGNNQTMHWRSTKNTAISFAALQVCPASSLGQCMDSPSAAKTVEMSTWLVELADWGKALCMKSTSSELPET